MSALPDTIAIGTADPARARTSTARVGPNAVIQLSSALADLEGEDEQWRVFASAGFARLLCDLPHEMIDEAIPARLFDAVRRCLPADRADAVLREAGTRTGAYILANRIPGPARTLLRLLPSPIAARVLLKAISQHAWTFAGSGIVTCSYGRPLAMTIAANPLATPGCPWHTAVLEHLFQALAGKHLRVRHDACCCQGAAACTFHIAESR